MKPNKIEMSSVDGTRLNLEALYQIAPSCFTEVKDEKTGELRHVVNFKTLRQLLGDNAVEDADEMYQFTWPGKQEARREAARPTTKTLRPVVEDSVDWDNTHNLYIEGDNLEVLKLLQKSYMGKVKMIYIDPPYNTGNDFVYDDDFALSQDDYDLFSGNVDELGNRYRKNTDSNARFHSDWCSMIYSRLMVARSLLSEDGVIFISIDDNEVENLKKIGNEIFGIQNFVGMLSVENNPKGRKNSSFISVSSEYCIIYAKNKSSSYFIENVPKQASDMTLDENGRYVHNSGKRVLVGENSFNNKVSKVESDKNYSVYYRARDNSLITKKEKIDDIDNVLISSGYRKYYSFYKNSLVENTYTDSKLKELHQLQALEFSNDKIYEKNFSDKIRIKSLLVNKEYEAIVHGRKQKYSMELTTTGAGTILKSLFGTRDSIFTAPKNPGFLKLLISLIDSTNFTVLDFFSGSATTAHAVMQLNAEDGGNRKYIMVQLPEETPEDSEARKAGYNTIPEIAKERIRRAGKKIKEESPLTTQNLDTGFRVFRLADSNFEEVKKAPGEYDQSQLDLFLNNVKSDRSDLDLLFGAMLSWGVQLSLPMTSEKVDGKMIYSVNEGDLVACFAEDITENIVKAMADKQPLRVLFRDRCFVRDDAKINVFETLKQLLDWSEEEAMKNIKVI